jgi:MFS family permease
MIFLSPVMASVNARFGTRPVMTFGMALGVLGLIVLALMGDDPTYARLLPGFLLFGLSLGIVYASMSTAAMQAMPRAKAGIASGVLAMSRVLSGALALAAVGAVFQSLDSAHRKDHSADDAFIYALGRSLWIPVAMVAIGAVLTWVFVRSAPAPDPAPGEEHHFLHHRRFHL